MGEKSNIEWTDSTFNPWVGCTKVSPACDHCYAEAYAKRTGQGYLWDAGKPRRRTTPANWCKPLAWNAEPFVECKNAECGWRGEKRDCAGRGGEWCPTCTSEVRPARRRVFCASLADVFDNEVPAEWRADLFRLIAATPHLDWLLLTKRIGNAARMLNEAERAIDKSFGQTPWEEAPWPNVWIGATVVNQAEADRDVPKLLEVPARVRFLSIEPMLGPIDLDTWPESGCGRNWLDASPGIDWVIAGGESGPQARPMHPAWVRSLRDQCEANAVPFLYKQWGEWRPCGLPGPHATSEHIFPDGTAMMRIGKKYAGRMLDGITHDLFPVVP
jgi:protein gp37